MTLGHALGRRAAHPWLALGLTAVLAACASAPPGPGPRGPAQAVVHAAYRMLGTPYRYGGDTPRGFDCSGLVHYSYLHAGIAVPRTVAGQYRNGLPVRHLHPGDAVFFRMQGQVDHVGIYVGGGRFIHAPAPGERVRRASLDNPYWRRRYAGARRLR